LGAGSGFYTMMLSVAGIEADKLIAVDTRKRKFCDYTGQGLKEMPRIFWKVDAKYDIGPDDAILIAWGDSMSASVEKCLESGCKLVFIQGETEMTFSNDYLQDRPDWTTVYHEVASPVESRSELLSVNIKVV
jgi:hypothetical protein